jgi:disulfide bond formation protein DsbB
MTIQITHTHLLTITFLLCAFALSAALIGQYMFGLHPCEFCIYQRIPFVATLIVCLYCLIVRNITTSKIGIVLSALFLVINAGLAFYHSGLERKWWASSTGCTTPNMSGSIEDLMAKIQSTSVVRCDEISWEFLGLTMANFNVGFCLGLAGLLIWGLNRTRQSNAH